MPSKLLGIIVLFISVACSFQLPGFLKPKPNIKITNHTQPVLSVDISPFEKAGCVNDSYFWRCPEGTELKAMGCDFIEASNLLGGLTPAYPMVLCKTRLTRSPTDSEMKDYLYRDGCLISDLVRLVVFKDGQFQLIKTLDELKKEFAPIDTSDEVLSYALAATGFTPAYGYKVESGFRYFVSTLEDTYVTEKSDGYQINLYDKPFCGCGPHPTYRIDVVVSKDGSLTLSERQKIFENTAEDGLCID